MKNHPQRLSPEAYGLRHLAFQVENVPAVVEKLEAMDIPVSYTHLAVVGATYPEMGKVLRKVMPKAYILLMNLQLLLIRLR